MSKPLLPKVITIRSITEYWDSLKPENDVDSSLEDSWKAKIELLDQVSLQNNVIVFLYNVFTNRFLYVSDKLRVLSGLDPALYTAENGMEYAFSRTHPNHAHAALQFNYLAGAAFSADVSYDKKSILAGLNFLLKNGNDEYVQVFQQIAIIEFAPDGKPALSISFGHYVGHIKKFDSIGCVISTPDNISIYTYNNNTKSIDPPKTFSDHEKKIIELLAQGMDSKTIAKKLSISPHTVDTHRRNLIKKMDCIDTTGVVAFAKLINLI